MLPRHLGFEALRVNKPWRTATEMLTLLRTGDISSLALLEQHIQRVQQLDPAINAVVVRDFDNLFWAGYPGVVGLPATAIPIGQSPEGLPVGAQIIGDTLADPLCLKMARWLETEWCGFVPPPHLS